jgi:hypothetical protein
MPAQSADARRVQHAMRIDHLDSNRPVVQQLGGSATIAPEAERHVFGGERIAVVEGRAGSPSQGEPQSHLIHLKRT